MKKLCHNILSLAMVTLLLLFSSGVHVLVHHCLVADETEIVFSSKQIACDHHQSNESSCCGHNHENDCCNAEQKTEHNCSNSHIAYSKNNVPLDKVSFVPITCEVNEFDLVLDKNNISQPPTFDLEKEFVLLQNNVACETLFCNSIIFKNIQLQRLLLPDKQPVIFTGVETVYLFHCPKIPNNQYC